MTPQIVTNLSDPKHIGRLTMFGPWSWKQQFRYNVGNDLRDYTVSYHKAGLSQHEGDVSISPEYCIFCGSACDSRCVYIQKLTFFPFFPAYTRWDNFIASRPCVCSPVTTFELHEWCACKLVWYHATTDHSIFVFINSIKLIIFTNYRPLHFSAY